MAKEYYLVSQLPDISACTPKSTLPITVEYYKDLCKRFMSSKDKATLEKLALTAPKDTKSTGSLFLDEWFEWDRMLHLALAQVRAAKLKKDAGVALSPIMQDVMQVARTAVNMDSPLSAEMYLYEAKLAQLENIKPLDTFCTDSVFCYGVRLILLERMKKFDKERGASSYKEIYSGILDGAK